MVDYIVIDDPIRIEKEEAKQDNKITNWYNKFFKKTHYKSYWGVCKK